MRLVIGGPTRDIVPASFAIDLAHLYAAAKGMGDVWLRFIQATYVHTGREAVLESAMRELAASHILWLDTDMQVPPDIVQRLAEHDQPFVACNYVTRDGSGQYTASRHGQPVATYSQSSGLAEVDAVGFGCVLMRTEIVHGLARPWFRHGHNGAHDIGEDVMFCRALKAAGHTLYIDHDASKDIKHIGQHAYGLPRPVALAV